jgi:hypothetical protein
MKTNLFIQGLTAALLLAAAPTGTHAESLVTDGDFDALPVGTAPDRGNPAGGWFQSDRLDWSELAPSQISIAPGPAGGTGNALRFSFAENGNPGHSASVTKLLIRPVTAASGQILNVSFDIYVEPGAAGPAVVLEQDDDRRTAQLVWGDQATALDKLTAAEHQGPNSVSAPTTLLPTYPRGIWQTVRLEVDLTRARYNFYWSEKGQPVSVTRTDLRFHRADTRTQIRQISLTQFVDITAAMRASFDNFRVTTDPVITPVNADLVANGSTTLQLLNLQTDSAIQWQFNGVDLANATNATLELSGVTTQHSGSYRAVVTAGGEVVTTDPSTVRVFDRLTITTPPQPVSLPVNRATGFSVAAVGPLPMTYQWRRNGEDLPGKTNRFLTLSATAATEGVYTVVVSDADGSVVSEPAPLTVLVRPAFTQAPLAQSVVAGGSATFSAQITGAPAPFTYQWRKGTTFANSTVLTEVQSAGKTAFFTLHNVQPADAGTYLLYLANPAAPDLTSTSPSRSFTLTVLPDGDGLPDEWETAHGLNPASSADAPLDADGDGQSNLAEHQAGTVPTSAASALRLETVTHANGQAAVSFPAAANRTYTVEWKADAAGGSWQKLADVVAQAADHTVTVTDAAAGEGARFYRVVTPRQP